MKPISFFVPCLPPTVTAQQKGVFMVKGKPRFFKKAEVKESENTIFSLLQPFVPAQPFIGPVSFTISFYFPWRKSEKRSVIAAFGMMPIDTRPDCSNLVKTYEDVMTTLRFWNDDSQIADLRVQKFYVDADEVGIRIAIWPCEGRRRINAPCAGQKDLKLA